MITTLKQIVAAAAEAHYGVPQFNVWGYEDTRAVIDAGQMQHSPLILGANRVAIEHMSVEHIGPLLRGLAEHATVPVVVHLDHCDDIDTIKRAIQNGFSSVMYDGSKLPLEQNIANSQEVVRFAQAAGVSVEGEVGAVPYADATHPVVPTLTDPQDAQRYAEQTGVDAMAIAIGTIHRLRSPSSTINYETLAQIETRTAIPLVVHGTSGIPDEQLSKLVAHRVAKLNIGTRLRQAFVETLHMEIEQHPDELDRVALFKAPMRRVTDVASAMIRLLGCANVADRMPSMFGLS